jgi:hypothetical protein
MKNRDQFTKELDFLITRLSGSLTEEDLDCGWTIQSQTALLISFKKIKNEAENTTAVKNSKISGQLVRGMDHWGIVKGELLEAAVRIENLST